jgi:hypothetical protein
MTNIRSYKDLRVYQAAIDAAMRIFEITKRFPLEERFSMVDQMRRASRSVCANIGEAWRKRRYPAHFISKLSDSEGEAEEKPEFGWTWRSGADIYPKVRLQNLTRFTMEYSVNLCA